MNNHEFKYSGERSPWRSEFPLQTIRVYSCAFVVTSERLAAPRSGFSGTTEPTCSSLNLHPFAAFSKAAVSILSISITACMTRFAFPASGSANISPRKTGLTWAISLGGFQPGRKYELCSSLLHLAFWLSLAYSRSAQQIYAANSKKPVRRNEQN